MPGGTLVPDHVLEGKIEELVCKDLEAMVAQVLPSCSCITVSFENTKGRREPLSVEEGKERYFSEVPIQKSVLNKS